MNTPRLSSTFLKAAFLVLKRERRPLTARAITAIAVNDGYLEESARGGVTPWQTMKSKLSVHIRRLDERSIFVRTAPGKFYLRGLLADSTLEYRAPPFRPGPPRERIVVFPQHALDKIGRIQGVSHAWEPYFSGIALGSVCQAMDRMYAETVLDVKQILTYTLVRRRSDGSLLCFDRGVINRADDSLRGLTCVGFGGHVKALNKQLFDVDDVALYRSAAMELLEELQIPPTEAAALRSDPASCLRMLGVLNDDSSANGRRHFAFVFEYLVREEAAWNQPMGGEKSINQVRWLTTDTARHALMHRFEFWSQMCLREFARDLATESPDYRARRSRVLRKADVVCLVGRIGSGKSEATSCLRDEFGFAEINSGRVLAKLLNVAPVPETDRATFQALANRFISRSDGPTRLGHALADAAQAARRRTVIDGIRHIDTLDALRTRLGRARVAVVYVYTPFDIALDLYRRREDPDVSVVDFVTRRDALVEAQADQMMDVADAAFYNWFGLDEYLDVVRRFAREHLCGSLS